MGDPRRQGRTFVTATAQPVEYHAFDDPVHDRLLGVILALAAELWVLRDRIGLLGQILGENGDDISDAIDRLAARPEHGAEIAEDRAAFLERVLQGLRDALPSVGRAR